MTPLCSGLFNGGFIVCICITVEWKVYLCDEFRGNEVMEYF